MGQSASSEPEVQIPQEDDGARGGVRMTVSSRVVDNAKASKSTDAHSSEKSAGQGARNEESSKSTSNASAARSRPQERQEPVSSAARSPLTRENTVSTTEYAGDELLENLKKQIESTVIPKPVEPTWGVPTADLARDALEGPVRKIAFEEIDVLHAIQEAALQIDTFPEPKSFHYAVGGQAQPICGADYLAATDCIKSGNPAQCGKLMDAFSECSAAHHFKQQVKAAQAPRQL